LKKELSKVYHPSDVEQKWYQKWIDGEVFTPTKDNNKESFTVMIPPPNVTGILHIGHVLNNSIQDVLVRRARMQGKNTLWLPGTDHASIATETKVTKYLKEQGIDKKSIGRDKFLEHCWKWTEKYGGIITGQLKRLGCSCDWSRERFTMDDQYYKSVVQTFVKLYNDGLVYQGTRMINWDPVSKTALSNEEVIYKEEKGFLWHIKYPIKGENEYLIVATTRPETMLGDTGVAINPKDKRYKKYLGKSIILPIINKEIPIFADEYVDMDFGTGCVKVTPAHDINDYAMAQRNNLDIINIMYDDAKFNKNVPKEYQNKDRFEVRKMILDRLDNTKFLLKTEDYIHKVGHSERTNAIIEPRLSKQWFLKMEDLAEPALKVVKNKEVKFYPDRWDKIYNHWLNNIQDWCISRQLWWGHRIPVWYKDDKIYCDVNPPKEEGWIQEEDVLDTWFSSWVWPLAALGWPNEEKDVDEFYPTQDLVTGPDIIFFWVARMIMSGIYFKNKVPFSNVYFTSIIRDEIGQKMSKSLGNSPDALELFDKYGVDAVRISILMMAPQGIDIHFKEERLDQGRNFMNKLWNCSRFIMMNLDDNLELDSSPLDITTLDETDKWILCKLNNLIKDVDKSLNNYKINDAIKRIYNFVWGDYCDWYIEFSKSKIYGPSEIERKKVLSIAVYVLKNILKLLHPFAPFITEEIWSFFDKNNFLAKSSYPELEPNFNFLKEEKDIDLFKMVITSIRNIKSNLGISPKKEIKIYCRGIQSKTAVMNNNKHHLLQLVNVKHIECGKDIEKPDQSATSVINNLEIFIPLKGLIDIDKELARLEIKLKDLKARLNNIKKKLDNENFVKKAPKDIIDHEQKKYDSYLEDYDKLLDNYNSLVSQK
tara:strand:+ start:379 stop:3006 length:2628 start_codon:yes stop_codon:yes gene_type:complete